MLGLVPCQSASLEALPVDMTSADLDEVAEDEFGEENEEEKDERAGHTRRWVRYVMPVMVEVDCDTDEITSVSQQRSNRYTISRPASVHPHPNGQWR
jgi:hypothetical protein